MRDGLSNKDELMPGNGEMSDLMETLIGWLALAAFMAAVLITASLAVWLLYD